ncbi:hypothetical protein, partial [Enterococcus durans]|uniref:hypothetical protein n=1 Tax=Enterococcus durans TaxID=53345 RepID=UPI003DA2B3F5
FHLNTKKDSPWSAGFPSVASSGNSNLSVKAAIVNIKLKKYYFLLNIIQLFPLKRQPNFRPLLFCSAISF